MAPYLGVGGFSKNTLGMDFGAAEDLLSINRTLAHLLLESHIPETLSSGSCQ